MYLGDLFSSHYVGRSDDDFFHRHMTDLCPVIGQFSKQRAHGSVGM